MMEYFPGVYWPNLLFNNAMASGATAGDMDDACRSAQNLMRSGKSENDREFKEALISGFTSVADKLDRLIADDLRMKRAISAGDKSFRLTAILNCLELLMDDFYDPRKLTVFDRQRTAFKRALQLSGGEHQRSKFIQVPFEGVKLDALFTPADREGAAPVVIHLNGTHSTIEWQYLIGIVQNLASRGIASLSIDHPGSGTARYHHGLKYRPDSECYTGAIIDHISALPEVDPTRIGVCGSSFGGYFAPRAAARESRIGACVVWGATYKFPTHRYFPDGKPKNGGALPSAYDEERARQQRWSHGAKDNIDLYEKMESYNISGDIGKIKVPLLIVHGKNDPQSPVATAKRMFVEASGSPRAELMIVGPEIGGDMHCNVDNPRTTTNAISDWLSEVFEVGRA